MSCYANTTPKSIEHYAAKIVQTVLEIPVSQRLDALAGAMRFLVDKDIFNTETLEP